MPISALPEHLKDIKNNFPDDKQFGDEHWWARLYTWCNQQTKTWFAFSYRCTEWWAKWRKYPKVLIALKGDGPFRLEYKDGDVDNNEKRLMNRKLWVYRQIDGRTIECMPGYLSRIQYWTRWHFAIQWPFMVSFHFYPNAADVPKFKEPRPDLDGKVWFFYWNHFDADLVYWMVTSAYLGRNWK